MSYIQYSNDEILFRKLYIYGEFNNVTEFRYWENEPLPTSITERTYDDPKYERLSEVFEKLINSRESREIYKYNSYGDRERKEVYSKFEPGPYTTYSYEYYP